MCEFQSCPFRLLADSKTENKTHTATPKTLLICTDCNAAFWCSKSCQKQASQSHAVVCSSLRAKDTKPNALLSHQMASLVHNVLNTLGISRTELVQQATKKNALHWKWTLVPETSQNLALWSDPKIIEAMVQAYKTTFGDPNVNAEEIKQGKKNGCKITTMVTTASKKSCVECKWLPLQKNIEIKNLPQDCLILQTEVCTQFQNQTGPSVVRTVAISILPQTLKLTNPFITNRFFGLEVQMTGCTEAKRDSLPQALPSNESLLLNKPNFNVDHFPVVFSIGSYYFSYMQTAFAFLIMQNFTILLLIKIWCYVIIRFLMSLISPVIHFFQFTPNVDLDIGFVLIVAVFVTLSCRAIQIVIKQSPHKRLIQSPHQFFLFKIIVGTYIGYILFFADRFQDLNFETEPFLCVCVLLIWGSHISLITYITCEKLENHFKYLNILELEKEYFSSIDTILQKTAQTLNLKNIKIVESPLKDHLQKRCFDAAGLAGSPEKTEFNSLRSAMQNMAKLNSLPTIPEFLNNKICLTLTTDLNSLYYIYVHFHNDDIVFMCNVSLFENQSDEVLNFIFGAKQIYKNYSLKMLRIEGTLPKDMADFKHHFPLTNKQYFPSGVNRFLTINMDSTRCEEWSSGNDLNLDLEATVGFLAPDLTIFNCLKNSLLIQR